MNLDEGEQDIKSLMGSLCSIILMALTILYSIQKADVLISKKDVDILSTINDDTYTSDDVFAYKNGFNIAVAFTAFDSESEWILDPTYGSLEFNHFSWGQDEIDGSPFTRREKKLEHMCSQEELGLSEDRSQSKFMPINESSKPYVELY